MILNFTDPFFSTRVLGFEPLFDRLQRLSESNDRSSSYPPYNISKDGNSFSIEIAVAGLSKDDIQIELADGQPGQGRPEDSHDGRSGGEPED